MKQLLQILFFTSLCCTGFSQVNCSVKKAYAFYTETIPGVQMADENGNPIPPVPVIDRFVYIEWTGAGKPEISQVLYNNKKMQAEVTAVDGNTLIPGGDVGNNSDYSIKANKCHSLWKIQLQTVSGNEMPAIECRNIIIKLQKAGNNCEVPVANEIKLSTFLRY